MKQQHSKGSGFFMGAIVGGVLTAITSMFLGTKQGKKVKHEAAKKYHEAVDKYEEVEGMAKKMMHKTKKKTAKHKHKRK